MSGGLNLKGTRMIGYLCGLVRNETLVFETSERQ